jgi:DNA polymerase-3 subunit epsilon
MSWPWPWAKPTALDDSRWLVVDVETSGLDPHTAELLAIAGVAINLTTPQPRIDLSDSFTVFLRPATPVLDKDNILLHGIGVQAQRDGAEPAQALRDFQAWAAASPLLGYHSAFDEVMLARAFGKAGLAKPDNPWLDLAPVLRELWHTRTHRALDDWLQAFGITCLARHQAAADALATAQLALLALRRWQEQGHGLAFSPLQRMAQNARWLHNAAT